MKTETPELDPRTILTTKEVLALARQHLGPAAPTYATMRSWARLSYRKRYANLWARERRPVPLKIRVHKHAVWSRSAVERWLKHIIDEVENGGYDQP